MVRTRPTRRADFWVVPARYLARDVSMRLHRIILLSLLLLGAVALAYNAVSITQGQFGLIDLANELPPS